jgi:cardiolipin synthase
VGNTIGAAFTSRRVLEPVEARLATMSGVAACVIAVLSTLFPRALAYPFAALAAWAGIALLHLGYRLHRAKTPKREIAPPPAANAT